MNAARLNVGSDGVPLTGKCKLRQVESLGLDCPMMTEYEPEQRYVDSRHDKTLEHSEAKINTGKDCLGFSIKTVEHRANMYHFVYSSKEEDTHLIPKPLREGDQILKITIIDKNDEETEVLTKDIVGIGSHREVIETLENVNSLLHLLSLFIRRKDDMDRISFYEILFTIEVTDNNNIIVESIDILKRATIPGTHLVVTNMSPPHLINIKLHYTATTGSRETQRKDVGWIVSKENEIILGEYHDDKAGIEGIAVQSFDIKSGAIVFLRAFRIRDTHLFITVKGDGDHHQVAMETHTLTDKDSLPKQILFRHVKKGFSTFESLEAPGYLLAAGYNNRLTLVKSVATDSRHIRTHLFELMFKDPPTESNVIISEHNNPQRTAQALRGKPSWRAWTEKLKFWKSADAY